MRHSSLTIVIILAIALTLLTSCGSTLNFEGTWIDKKTESKVLIIKKAGSDYFVTISNQKLPAKLVDNQIVVDNERTIAIDKSTNTVVFLGEDYIPMDGNQFLGKWQYNNRYELMEITKKGNDFNVAWKSKADIYQPHEIVCKFVDGQLLGDYYGHTKNFVLNVVGNKKISLTVDPFAEFQPIRNEYFSPTESVFIVSSGDDFIGYWKYNWSGGTGDTQEVSLNISKVGSYYNTILYLKPDGNWQWNSYFNNEQLISNQSVDGERPILKLIDEDSILLTDFYMMGSTEQGMKLVSKTPQNKSSTQQTVSENSQAANTNQTAQQSNDNKSFYIISVTATKTETEAKSKADQLKTSGNSAGYLWIPDYASLSGAKLYAVYIGPFLTQHDCEVAVEEYRKKNPAAYGLLVSQDKKRVQVNGIGKVTITQQ